MVYTRATQELILEETERLEVLNRYNGWITWQNN